MVNRQSKQAALAVDFLKFMTNKDNAQKMTADLGWLSAVKGSATAQNSFPQLSGALADIDKASQFAIWLDTVTNADVAGAYLSGVEGIIDGSQTPQQVMASVQNAAQEGQEAGRLSTRAPATHTAAPRRRGGRGTATEKGNLA